MILKSMKRQDLSKDKQLLKSMNLSEEDFIDIITAREAIVSKVGLDDRVDEALYRLHSKKGLENTEMGFYLVENRPSKPEEEPHITKKAVMPEAAMERFRNDLTPGELEFIRKGYLVLDTNHSGHLIVGNHKSLPENIINYLNAFTLFNLTTTVKNAVAYDENFKNNSRDDLTGAYKRNFFMDQLQRDFTREVLRGHDEGLGFMMLDIDYFKKYNDMYGHPAGDYLLRNFVKILKAKVREDIDMVCRYGGEEFCISMPNISLKGLEQKAEELVADIRDFKFRGEDKMPGKNVTASIGIAHAPTHEIEKPSNLLWRADKALYAAKGTKENPLRDRVVMYNPDIHGEPPESEELE